MKDKFFLDTNIIIYSFGNDVNKKHIANELLKKHPVISIQVLNEVSNVLNKKLNVSIPKIKASIDFLSKICTVKTISIKTTNTALDILQRYKFSFFDSLIISSALENNCIMLYSEDMNAGQIIEGKLKIINPFL